MTINHRYNHIVIFALIITVGLGLALALPWLANAQGLAAQNGVPAQDNAPDSSHIHYVAITGTGTGVSWTEAFTNVQDALGAALAGDEIWVAKGVYYPDVGSGQINDSITATFLMTDGVSIFGGFEFGDTNFTDRDWENNVTVLSGDVDGDDDTDTNDVVIDAANINGNNAYHVVTGSGVTITAVLDGFTITAGDADGSSSPHNKGGGMYNDNGSPALTNVVFSGNSASNNGGGMSNFDSSPALTNVVFSGNSAEVDGGGMYNESSNSVLTNVVFSGNSADFDGGGMFNGDSSSPALTNVTFSGNSAVEDGGGMLNDDSSPALTNVTFSGNSAVEDGGGMYNESGSPDVRNSILWNNMDSSGTGTISATIYLTQSATITLTHSLVQDSLPGGSWIGGSYVDGGDNIDQNPMFVTPINPSDAPTTTGNLRLQTSSPAIDKGNNIYVAGVLTDLDGEARVKDGNGDGTATVDMGAYEAKGYYYLTVSKSGAGGGLVTSSPAGIDCGDTCSVYLQEDSAVTLTATADEDSTFSGWSGACSGTADCMVTMDAAKSVTATFMVNDVFLPVVMK